MKILFIKQLWTPEPTAKSLDFALELKRRGHHIQVLTGFPSYPLGRIYHGYRQKIWQKENMKGIDIFRVPIYPNHSSNSKKRVLHYLSYGFSASLIGPFLVKKPDVAFVYQGAIPVGIPAMVFKYLRGVPYVYDINDLWPETVKVSGMMRNKFLLGILERWSLLNLSHAGKISVATRGFKKNLEAKGIPKHKMLVVPNWSRDEFRTDKLPDNERELLFPKNCVNILYAGNLGIVQSLYTVLKGMKILQGKGYFKIRLTLLGGGAEELGLREYALKHKINNVFFLSRVSESSVGLYLNSADILLVHLMKNELFSITIPSKILSYLRYAKPILMGLVGDAAEILTQSNAGILFEPDSEHDFASKALELYNLGSIGRANIGKNGPKYYDKNLSLESSTDKLEALMLEVAKR